MAGQARWIAKVAMAAALVAAGTGLSACGGVDGVELNGKIFDAMGVSGDLFAKKAEPKTEARAPLVLPPDANRLPEPGAAPIMTSSVDPQWPASKEDKAVAAKRAQEEYCKDGNWKKKAVKDEVGADKGPEGSCTPSLFSTIGKALQN